MSERKKPLSLSSPLRFDDPRCLGATTIKMEGHSRRGGSSSNTSGKRCWKAFIVGCRAFAGGILLLLLGQTVMPALELTSEMQRVGVQFGLFAVRGVTTGNLLIPIPDSTNPQGTMKSDSPKSAQETLKQINGFYGCEFMSKGKRGGFGYSGMWWMNRTNFLQLDLQSIRSLEGASFRIFNHLGDDRVLLTRDWLDMNVEHLSRYFKSIGNDRYPPGGNYSLSRKVELIQDYMEKVTSQHESVVAGSTASAQTIAIIPIYVSETGHTRAGREEILETYSLVATIVSLWHIGIPRIVVVGNVESTPGLVKRAFEIFSSKIARDGSANKMRSLRETTLHYFRAEYNRTLNSSEPIIMPKEALINLQQAMLHQNQESSPSTNAILGDNPSYWQYIYFTEPDLILHVRASALSAFTERLKSGNLLAAHRFQPLPHQVDFPNYTWPTTLLPSNANKFMQFYDLDLEQHSCCFSGDEQPALDEPSCGREWYSCGFDKWIESAGNDEQELNHTYHRHKRLLKYPLVRLVKEGLGVPLVNEHAYRCKPSKKGSCK